MELQNVLIAFALTLFAGLSTGFGSALAFFARRTNTKLLSGALGFSAGVMLYVSFVEIFPKAKDCLSTELGRVDGYWVTVLAFFAGIVFIGIIDKLVPAFENPHEAHRAEEMDAQES
ncbi:MAG: ZIP family transporter, partial [Planctomycetota bacterium]